MITFYEINSWETILTFRVFPHFGLLARDKANQSWFGARIYFVSFKMA